MKKAGTLVTKTIDSICIKNKQGRKAKNHKNAHASLYKENLLAGHARHPLIFATS
jgi:hypothetical protein